MNTHVCRHCGSLIRRASSKCSSCGNLITKASAFAISQLSESAPNIVALADPLLAEKMILRLQNHELINELVNQDNPEPGRGSETSRIAEPNKTSKTAKKRNVQREFANELAEQIKFLPLPELSEPESGNQPEKAPPQPALVRDFFAESVSAPLSTHLNTEPPLKALEAPLAEAVFAEAALTELAAEDLALKEKFDSEKLIARLVEASRSTETDNVQVLDSEASALDSEVNAGFFDRRAEIAGCKQKLEANKTEKERQEFQESDSEKHRSKRKMVLIVLGGISAILLVLAFAINAAFAPLSLNGNYGFHYTYDGKSYTGNCTLRQEGSHITGEGVDDPRLIIGPLNRSIKNVGVVKVVEQGSKRSFVLEGESQADGRFLLEKQYIDPQTKKPGGLKVTYYGRARNSNKLNMLWGYWYLEGQGEAKPGGEFSFSQTRRERLKRVVWQKWHKQIDGKMLPDLPGQKENWLQSIFWNKADAMALRFGKILLTFVLSGLGILALSFKFFGMHGLLSIWEREKYIPYSLRSKHHKLMRELGQAKGTGSLFLGQRQDWGVHEFWRPRSLYLPAERRKKHPHFIALGSGAKGKTRLLASMVLNDIKSNERALVLVDSDGSLCRLLVSWLASNKDAKKHLGRVRIIDPCNRESFLAYNPFANECLNQEGMQSIAQAVTMGFKAVYTESQNQQNQWTQQTANILRNAVLLLLLNDKNLEDLPVLLSDNDYRDLLLQNLEKKHAGSWKTLLDAWSNYKRLARSEQWLNWIEPILNRVQPLLSDPRISALLNTRSNCVDLNQLLEDRGILLVRVPRGQLDKGADLLGSLIVTGLKQAAMMHYERTGQAANPCSLYLDEMNHFMDAESFESICSDARKTEIAIHGTLKTLQDLSEEYRNKILINTAVMALFSISKKDADLLGPSVFRVDGRKRKKVNLADLVNPVNSNPNMDLASDEEKMNINRLIGQDERSYYCHLLGTEAGVFSMRAPDFRDAPRDEVDQDLIESLYDSRNGDDEEPDSIG